MKKGQFAIEYLGAMLFFILALLLTVSVGIKEIPGLNSQLKKSSKNLEAREVLDQLMISQGYHNSGSGGTNWEKTTTTRNHITELGLAKSPYVLSYDKVKNLTTLKTSGISYEEFKNLTDADFSYRFKFVWLPVVETPNSFFRTEPEAGITEPLNNTYDNASNTVYYGNQIMFGNKYYFLVTAHDGVYNSVYMSLTKNFAAKDPHNPGEKLNIAGKDFKIKAIQNIGDKPGTMFTLKRNIKVFGANVETDSTVTRINRYAVLKQKNSEPEPVRIEVLTW